MFVDLVQPLTDAWAYKMMRLTAPNIYKTQVSEIYTMWEAMHKAILAKTNGDTSKWRREVIGMWAILQEDPDNNVRLSLKTPSEYQADWEKYMNLLKENIPKDPSVQMYMEMVIKTNANYTVSIGTDPIDKERYFDIRGKK